MRRPGWLLRPARRRLLAGVVAAALGPAVAGSGAPAAPPVPLPAAATPVGDRIYPALGQAGLDVLHYDVQLTVARPGSLTLRGVVTARVRARQDLPLVSLDDLGPPPQTVRWNGQPVPFTLDRDAGKLQVRRALPRGQEASVEVAFSGPVGVLPDPTFPFTVGWQGVAGAAVTGSAAVAGGPAGNGANFSFSEPDGTRTFLPVNDHPSDPATFTVTLTVPVGFEAAASGERTRVHDTPGWHTVTFEQTRPIPTYALAVHVGRLEAVDTPASVPGADGRPVARRDYFPPGTPDEIRAPYRRTDEILRVLGEWFGPYPFATYGSAVVTPRLPALETATLSTIPLTSSTDRVLVHETAHQWFGNSVTPADWSDVWLSEGFATYAELLWQESQGGSGQALADRWYDSLRAQPSRPLVAANAAQLFDATAYRRGALALHALRLQVGDGAFRTFLRGYGQGGAGQSVRTADLLSYVRRTLGPGAEATLRTWVEAPALPPPPRPAAAFSGR